MLLTYIRMLYNRYGSRSVATNQHEMVIVYTVQLWADSHPNCGLSNVVFAVEKVEMTLYNDADICM